MTETPPSSVSPGSSLLSWDEAAVQAYFDRLGFSQYGNLIHGTPLAIR
jgi:hypothetical protein